MAVWVPGWPRRCGLVVRGSPEVAKLERTISAVTKRRTAGVSATAGIRCGDTNTGIAIAPSCRSEPHLPLAYEKCNRWRVILSSSSSGHLINWRSFGGFATHRASYRKRVTTSVLQRGKARGSLYGMYSDRNTPNGLKAGNTACISWLRICDRRAPSVYQRW